MKSVWRRACHEQVLNKDQLLLLLLNQTFLPVLGPQVIHTGQTSPLGAAYSQKSPALVTGHRNTRVYLSNCVCTWSPTSEASLASGVNHIPGHLASRVPSSLFPILSCLFSSLHVPSPTRLLCSSPSVEQRPSALTSTLASLQGCLSVCLMLPIFQGFISALSLSYLTPTTPHLLYPTLFWGAFKFRILTLRIDCLFLKGRC